MNGRSIPFMFALVPALTGGCVLLPPNTLHLIDPDGTGHAPTLVFFDRGACVQKEQATAALLASHTAVLLVDVHGRANRCELLLLGDRQYIVYERIGQRDRPLANEAPRTPQGVRLRRSGEEFRGYLDVFVERGRDDPHDPAFAHYPRALRIAGYLVVPVPPADGPGIAEFTDQLVAGGQRDSSATRPAIRGGAPGMSLPALVPGVALDMAIQRLVRLPIIDTKMLVPATVSDRMAPLVE